MGGLPRENTRLRAIKVVIPTSMDPQLGIKKVIKTVLAEIIVEAFASRSPTVSASRDVLPVLLPRLGESESGTSKSVNWVSVISNT
jgi:hypothetical protein